ncbi:MAG: hypothetical protein WBP93_01515, partial [Pyrinomonadaceae bacterium]
MSDTHKAVNEVKEAKDSQSSSSESVRDEYFVQTRRRRVTPLAIVIIVCAIALVILAWLIINRSKEQPEEEAVIEVEAAMPARTEMREYVEASGTLNAMPGHEASFSAATAGRVTRVLVQVGDRVRA